MAEPVTLDICEGEQIAIVFGGNKYTAEVAEVDDGGNATVTATLPSGTPNNQTVTFIYPASAADGSGLRSDLLATQDGTFETLSKELDVATAEGTLVVDGNAAQPNGTVTLENQFAICKFQFKDDSDQLINDIKRVKITDLATTEAITVTTPSPQSAIYVAMKPSQNSTKFEVVGSNGNIYKKTANAHLEAGMFYRPTFSTTFDIYACPLTFEAIASGTISFKNNAEGSVYYSINGGERVEIQSGSTGTTPTLTAGQKVCFYGDNETYCPSSDGWPFSSFSINGQCYIYGNIMSLISSTDFSNLKEFTSSEVFRSMFKDCSGLRNHPEKRLVLPATTLANKCYIYMFYRCTGLTKAPDLPATTLAELCYTSMFEDCIGLTKAPDLPATTLANDCYHSMFYGCTSLTTTPELPATSLREHCYTGMFWGCTSLTTAPELPATTMVAGCYEQMFHDCTSLTTAPELPATTVANYCYTGMFEGCTSLTTAPELPATTLNTWCYGSMFNGCTSLTTAPKLPATTLTEGCYYRMFQGCTNLNNVECLATSFESYSTDHWLEGVASSGTFIKAAGVNWATGTSGIPSGWTVTEE